MLCMLCVQLPLFSLPQITLVLLHPNFWKRSENIRSRNTSLVLWKQQTMKKVESLHYPLYFKKSVCTQLQNTKKAIREEISSFWEHSKEVTNPWETSFCYLTELLLKEAYYVGGRSSDYVVISWVTALHTYRHLVFWLFYCLAFYLQYFCNTDFLYVFCATATTFAH